MNKYNFRIYGRHITDGLVRLDKGNIHEQMFAEKIVDCYGNTMNYESIMTIRHDNTIDADEPFGLKLYDVYTHNDENQKVNGRRR